MPPSPVLRISRGRELRDVNYKRGRSVESGIACDENDDLALFNEVQNKEKEGFLLQSNYDFNDIFPMKLKNLSECKMPARGESSDLLNAVDKNDYDWLMTPPESPLFSSLDDEVPALLHASRGRPRSQPIAISRSSMDGKCYTSGRSTPSPRRMSPSPRSGNSMLLQTRSRSSSASRSSTTPAFSRASPSNRLSPPPSKPTVPVISSKRMSTDSAVSGAQFGTRGVSPVRTNLENYESPKIRAWQLNIPGFSSEVPPNLRTSLADRPRSYVRGSSPASRNSSRSGRQSMSPTASGSASSPHSHERDPFSSYSRGSIASSGDEDVDSLPSKTLSYPDHSVQRNIGSSPKNRSSGLYKKSTKTLSSSAPKRSFDLVLRQADKKSPHNMFRPLLSSAPSSTLYAGKESTPSLSLISKNSSITASSNASSDQGTSGALVIVEAEHKGNDVSNDLFKNSHPTGDEVFYIDQIEASNDDADNRVTDLPENNDPSPLVDYGNTNRAPAMELCSKCYNSFHLVELVMDGDGWLCRKCKDSEANPVETVMIDASPAGVDSNSGLVSFDLPEQFATELEPEQKQNKLFDLCLNTEIDTQGGTGLSLLLKRSSSVQGHIVPSRSYSDCFSLKDSLRSSTVQSSMSMSSSYDFGSSGHMDSRRHREPGDSKHKRSVSLALPRAPHHMSLVPSITPGSSECLSFEDAPEFGSNSVPSTSQDGEIKKSTRNHMDSSNEETSASNLEIHCTQGQDTPQSSCCDLIDAPEALHSANALSETEFKGYDTSSIVTKLQEDHLITPLDEPDFDNEEELMVSVTLEEATDVILLCSSIVDEIAYNAAEIAMNKEIAPTRVPRPAAPAPPSDKKVVRRISKPRQTKREIETKSPQSVLAENEGKSSPRIVLPPATTGPPKLESKCNCTIM